MHMNITVVGGGNIGTLMAAELAHKGHAVTMYTSKPQKWSKEVVVLDETDNILMRGHIASVTDRLEDAVKGAELIWIALPAELFNDFGKKLAPLVQCGQMIGVVPGSGGVEFAFRGVVEKGALLFGLQRVHSIARIEKYGHSVHMCGRKPRLELGAIPTNAAAQMSRLVENLFGIPCLCLPNYLSVTLTPSNPILHTARLYAMFKGYAEGMVYPRNYLFYEEWDDASSRMLLACDAELQRLCTKIPLDLSHVVSLKEYYESPTAEAMTRKIRGIKAFRGLTSPMVRSGDGWIPDTNSRYFTTDFPYGLKLIRDLAVRFEVRTPHIDTVWNWYAQFDRPHAAKAIALNMRVEAFLEMYR